MNAHTLSARETVREIRESLSRQEPTLDDLRYALTHSVFSASELIGFKVKTLGITATEPDYQSIELWARLAADLAGMIQQKERARP